MVLWQLKSDSHQRLLTHNFFFFLLPFIGQLFVRKTISHSISKPGLIQPKGIKALSFKQEILFVWIYFQLIIDQPPNQISFYLKCFPTEKITFCVNILVFAFCHGKLLEGIQLIAIPRIVFLNVFQFKVSTSVAYSAKLFIKLLAKWKNK